MTAPEDVTGALRAVWEVRRAEEQRAFCLGAWNNVIFGVMGMALFAAYGAAEWLAAPPLLFRWLWLPPLLAAYTALSFATKRVLRLPRPALAWREVAIGTGLFVGLMGLLALAVFNGFLRDIAAGMSIVIGVFYVILGLVFVRERAPALFGLAVAAGAVALALLRAPFPASTVYGVVVASGGMVAMGLWMLRHPEQGAPPAAAPPPGAEGGRVELEQVREVLAGIRGHEAAVEARERAAKAFLAAAVFALAGVTGFLTGSHPYPWALLAIAGVTAAFGMLRQKAARTGEARHGGP